MCLFGGSLKWEANAFYAPAIAADHWLLSIFAHHCYLEKVFFFSNFFESFVPMVSDIFPTFWLSYSARISVHSWWNRQMLATFTNLHWHVWSNKVYWERKTVSLVDKIGIVLEAVGIVAATTVTFYVVSLGELRQVAASSLMPFNY